MKLNRVTALSLSLVLAFSLAACGQGASSASSASSSAASSAAAESKTEEQLLAEENEILLLRCRQSMFRVCGELYKAGLLPVY